MRAGCCYLDRFGWLGLEKMGSNMNFKSFANEITGDGNGNGNGNGNGRSLGINPLTRQSSVYSLTFDEFQNTLGGMGKDFGSMNMDELLKNIWSAEETQTMTTAAAAAVGSSGVEGVAHTQGGYLQRQGSLTLPRTLSQKTVDEVWKDIAKEFSGGKDGATGSSVPQTQRQQTLGEMTLEEFLVRAGVVREDMPSTGKSNVGGFFGGCTTTNLDENNGFGINFQQPGRGVELISMQPTNLPLSINGARTPQPTPSQIPQRVHQQQPHQQQQQQQQQQTLFPKQVAASYAATGLVASPRVRGGNVGLSDQGINSNLVPTLRGAGMGMFGLGGGGAMGVPSGSPAPLSSDGLAKSNGDTSSVSPVPYVYNGGLRGRKCGHAVDKVVERRQRRMIKNRESAARSRARKQAYTMELEQEVAKLKAENEELRTKQQEFLEMQKNQVLEMISAQPGPRKRLRRTQTGPW